MNIKRIISLITAFAVILTALFVMPVTVSAADIMGELRTEANTGDMNLIPYNNDSITADLGVGIFAHPVAIDYNKDGYMDLVVQSPAASFRGTMVFYGSADSTNKESENYLLMDKGLYIGGVENVNNPQMTGSYIYDENGEIETVLVAENRTVYSDYSNKAGSFTLPDFALPQTIEGHPVGLEFDRFMLVDINNDGLLDVTRGICSNSEFQASGGYNEDGLWGTGSTDNGNDGDGDPNHGWVLWAENASDVKYGAAATYSELMLVMVQHADGSTSALHTEGNPSPIFWDFDGDGDLDIICCSSIDDVIYFENIGGSAESNLNAEGVFLCAEGVAVKKANGNATENLEALKVELCLPRTNLFDWDGDGDQDIIVGEEDGRVSLMENTGLLDNNGTPIFEAQKFFRTPADTLKDGVLSTPFSVDWDGDGDEDIITGNTAGYISYIENVTPKDGDLTNPSWAEPVRLKDTDGKVIRIQAGYNGSPQGPPEAKWGYTAVTVADWDGDGVLDIMSNDIWGKVRWYKGIAGEQYTVDGPIAVEVEWENGVKYPDYNWWKPEGNELCTYWRTTALMIDLNEDGLTDLVMSDHEGFMAFYERYEENGELKLKEGKRIFKDAYGNPMVLNTEVKALSGQNRAKIVLTDWDGDGDLDFLRSYSTGIKYFINIAENEGEYLFKEVGMIHDRVTAGHTSCPTVCDWDKNGQPDLIVGAECGHYYYLNREYANDDPPEIIDVIGVSTMKGWGWTSKDDSALINTSWKYDASANQVASSLVPNAWAGAWAGTVVVSSTYGTLTGPVAGKSAEVLKLRWMDVDVAPVSDSVMFYVELPKYDKSGADWALGLSSLGISQNETEYWASLSSGVSFSYLPLYGDSWETSTLATDAATSTCYFDGLPSGFKGYIRINFSNFSYNQSGIDFDSAYTFDYIDFTINSVGGTCGDMVFGGIFYMTANNSDALILECGNQQFALTRDPAEIPDNEKNIEIGNMKGWGWITKNSSGLKNVEWSYDTDTEQVGSSLMSDASYSGAVKLSSKDGALTGEIASKDTELLYMQWMGVTIDPTVDSVIFYVELPEYEKSEAGWALGIGGLAINQNEADTWVNLNSATKFSYLSVEGGEWTDSTINGGSTESARYLNGLPSGFKGYIRLNFNDFTFWGNVDLDSAYTFSHITFVLNSIGGDCGDLSFGGIFYVPSNNGNSTVMEIKGESFALTSGEIVTPDTPSDEFILVNNMKGWEWISKSLGDMKNISYTIDTSSQQVASALVPNTGYAWTGSYVVSSNDGTLTGPVANKTADQMYLQWAHIAIDPNYDSVMFYVELPDYEKSGAEWALGLSGLGINQNSTDYWVNLNNSTKYSYLSVDGEGWVESTINGSSATDGRYFKDLPSGFKGYIRINFEDFSYFNTPNLNDNYELDHIYFTFNSIGGECGDLEFGAIFYVESNKSTATVMKVGNQTFNLTNKEIEEPVEPEIPTDVNIKVDTLKGWGWVTKTVDSFNKLTLTADNNTTQVGSDYVPNGPQGAYKGKYVVASKDGSVTHTYVNEIMYMQWIGLAIDPDVDEVIFYVELPDYAKSDDTWGLGIQGMGILQNEVVTNVNPTHKTEFSYLSIDSNEWVTSTTTGGSDRTLNLPSGFKGYVRLNFENLIFDSAVNLDSEYALNHINFKFNAVGGDNGDLTFGGIFYVPSNKSNSTVMQIGTEEFNLTVQKSLAGDIDGDGVITATDLVALRKIVLGVETADDADVADVNGDGKVNVRDLVRLKKLIA